MNTVFLIIEGIVIVALLIIAIFLLNGKGAFLIAGYNTKNEEEKRKYDERAICRFVGWLLVSVCVDLTIFFTGIHLNITWLLWGGIAFMPVVVVGAVIYMNTRSRFRVDSDALEPGAYKKTKRTGVMVAVIAATAIVCIAVGALIVYGASEPAVDVTSSSIRIQGMYGLSIDIADITGVSLIEQSMSDIGVGQRTNGYGGFGGALKGNFKSDSLGETLLFVRANSSPTIRVERNSGKDVYISFGDGEKTEDLYREITGAIAAKR
ncbi:MAG: DUF3784 domain-containing protein [Dehalococcoidia bacterium]|nr:DUF3784 domain-containing protein [Dehalococcoidia bacterium]